MKRSLPAALQTIPELADGVFPTGRLSLEISYASEAFIVTLDLAAAYLQAGEKTKADSLLSLVESELPHWQGAGAWDWGYGIADVELYALRGGERTSPGGPPRARSGRHEIHVALAAPLQPEPRFDPRHTRIRRHRRRDRSGHGRPARAGARDGAQRGTGTDP